jgi:hypothetical protein
VCHKILCHRIFFPRFALIDFEQREPNSRRDMLHAIVSDNADDGDMGDLKNTRAAFSPGRQPRAPKPLPHETRRRTADCVYRKLPADSGGRHRRHPCEDCRRPVDVNRVMWLT